MLSLLNNGGGGRAGGAEEREGAGGQCPWVGGDWKMSAVGLAQRYSHSPHPQEPYQTSVYLSVDCPSTDQQNI